MSETESKPKADTLREKVEKELEAEDRGDTTNKRRVFQCLDETHPSQVVTLSVHAHTDAGVTYPARTRILSVNKAGQFVLPANAPDYEDQYRALKRMCKQPHTWPMVELDSKKENVLPKYLAGKSASPEEKLAAAQRKIDETSDLLTKQAQDIAAKEEIIEKATEEETRNKETIEGLQKQIAAMKKELAAVKKA